MIHDIQLAFFSVNDFLLTFFFLEGKGKLELEWAAVEGKKITPWNTSY